MTMLHEALRLVRVFHDMTQTQLAEKLAISKSYLSEIESGKKPVSMDLLQKYSNEFNVPASSLLLFSEKIESNTVSERTRVFVADKVLKMMGWLAAKGSSSDGEAV